MCLMNSKCLELGRRRLCARKMPLVGRSASMCKLGGLGAKRTKKTLKRDAWKRATYEESEAGHIGDKSARRICWRMKVVKVSSHTAAAVPPGVHSPMRIASERCLHRIGQRWGFAEYSMRFQIIHATWMRVTGVEECDNAATSQGECAFHRQTVTRAVYAPRAHALRMWPRSLQKCTATARRAYPTDNIRNCADRLH